MLDPADLVLKNGNIYTVSDKQAHAEAVAVKADRIVFVGSTAEVRKFEGQHTRVVDLGYGRDRGAWSGPMRTHHLSGVGFREMTLNLEGVASLEDFLAKVKARVDRAKPENGSPAVAGSRPLEAARISHALAIDQVSPNNPVILERADGHGAVANSAAFKVAGIGKDTPNPFGGEISQRTSNG